MTFGEKLKKERRRRKLDQTEFGQLIGVSLRTVVTYEKGQGFPRSRKDYLRIADALGVNVNYLLTEDDQLVAHEVEQMSYIDSKLGMQKIIGEVNCLFAGGELDEDDMDELLLSIQQAYIDAKRKNRAAAENKQ